MGRKSILLAINASIIQGSGLGPVSYILTASDLHPMHPSDIFFKYADDTYFLVPATNSSLISHELKNISGWAIDNNSKLNEMLRNGSISFKHESSAYTSPTARLNQS